MFVLVLCSLLCLFIVVFSQKEKFEILVWMEDDLATISCCSFLEVEEWEQSFV
jgi:hypothetical protein